MNFDIQYICLYSLFNVIQVTEGESVDKSPRSFRIEAPRIPFELFIDEDNDHPVDNDFVSDGNLSLFNALFVIVVLILAGTVWKKINHSKNV